jgi:peptidoglycan hydrolase-like protein with peptidoglycan-binding domain
MRFREFYIRESFTISNPAGKIGADVADVQKALVALGYELPRYGVDGIHGPETSGAIKKFQVDAKLIVNGETDDATIEMLNQLIKDRNIKLEKSTEKDVKRRSAQRSAANIDTKVIQDPDFNKKLEKIAGELNVKSSDLVAIMKQESGVNPQAVNAQSGATGLIQFMPSTARSLGTTTEELKSMTAVEQLDYVYKYFKMVGVGNGSLGDLYMAVFMPKYVGANDNTVLGSSGATGFSGKVYAQNAGLDRNRDGRITVGDVKQSVERYA